MVSRKVPVLCGKTCVL